MPTAVKAPVVLVQANIRNMIMGVLKHFFPEDLGFGIWDPEIGAPLGNELNAQFDIVVPHALLTPEQVKSEVEIDEWLGAKFNDDTFTQILHAAFPDFVRLDEKEFRQAVRVRAPKGFVVRRIYVRLVFKEHVDISE